MIHTAMLLLILILILLYFMLIMKPGPAEMEKPCDLCGSRKHHARGGIWCDSEYIRRLREWNLRKMDMKYHLVLGNTGVVIASFRLIEDRATAKAILREIYRAEDVQERDD